MSATVLEMTVVPGGVRFGVHAKPRASRSRVIGVKGGEHDVSIAAPPVDGEANRELLATLARAMGVPKRDVEIVRGESSRSKLVLVRGISMGEILARLGMGVT